MEYASDDLTLRERYKVLTAFVLPRPIAWVTTVGPTGVVNAAPFSFFNVFCEDPPLCMFGVNLRPDGRVKDTVTNIRRTGSSWSTSPMSRWRVRCTTPAATFRPISVSPAIWG
jgi:flavin reductase (DIM6/NTAB) family NADH-FMN oxidoreductase RutF